MSSMIPRGNINKMQTVRVTLSPSSVSANTTAQQTFTVPGVIVGDVVLAVEKPSHQAGLGIVGWRVTAANTVGITFSNNTGSGITPTASEAYDITVARLDSTSAVFQ
jgi:hypothetical protein